VFLGLEVLLPGGGRIGVRPGFDPGTLLECIRLANIRLAGSPDLVGRFGRPCHGRELGDSTDWKIGQPGQDWAQIIADGDFN
jgi:hypothetical protein